MPSLIGALRISLGLETAAFERGSKRAASEVDALGDRMEKVGFHTGRMIKTLAVGAGAIAGSALIGKLKDLATQGLEHASALGEEAQQLGVTTSALQRYRFMATQVGIDQDKMDAGLQKLSVTLGKLATGTDKQRGALEKYGFTTAEIDRLVHSSAEDALPLIADRFAALKSPTEQAALAAEFFGAKMGPKFNTLLAGGAKGISDLADAYNKLGIEVSAEQIARADEAADKLAAMQQVTQAQLAQFSADNAATLVEASSQWEQFKTQLVIVGGGIVGFFNTVQGAYARGQDAQKRYWDGVKADFAAQAGQLASALRAYEAWATGVNQAMARAYQSVKSWLQDKMAAVFDWLKGKLDSARRWFNDLMPQGAPRAGKQAAGFMTAAFGVSGLAPSPIPQFDEFADAANDNADAVVDANVRIAQSFKDMAEATLGALDRMAGAIKGGGFLDILSAVIGLGLQLGSIGVFGKGVAGRINQVPGSGGAVSLPKGGGVTLGGSTTLVVAPSPYFDVRVQENIGAAAPGLIQAGAKGGVARMAYHGTRRVA